MVVLTKKYSEKLRKILFCSYHVTNIPLQWDSQVQTLLRYQGLRTRILLPLNILLYIAFQLYVWVRFAGEILSDNRNSRHVVYLGYNGLANLLLMTILTDVTLKSERNSVLFNAALAYYGRVKGNAGSAGLSDKKFGIVWTLCRVLIMGNCINFIRRPEQPLFLSSLCGSWGIYKYIFLLFHAHIWIIQWSGALIGLGIYLIVFKIISSTAADFTYNPNWSGKDAAALRRQVHMRYAECSVLVTCVNSNFRWLLAILEALMTTTAVISFGAAAKTDGIVALRLLLVGIGLTTIFLLLLKNMAEAHENFGAMLSSWRRLPRQDAWMRGFLRSTVPRGLTVGNYFTVDRGLVLTVAGIIIDNTVTVLMTF